MTSSLPPSLEDLRRYIGRTVRYSGQPCEIIEILEDGPALVLACHSGDAVIQPNQYGDASRRVPQTRTIPIMNQTGTDLHPDYLLLQWD